MPLNFLFVLSRVFGTLLLLVPLVLPPGHWSGRCFCHIPGLLSCAIHCHRGRGWVEGSWSCGASAVSLNVGFVGIITVSRGGGHESGAFLQWGMGLQVPMPLLPISLWPWMLLWPRGKNHMCRFLYATCRFSHLDCCSRVTGTTFTVPPILPPLCAPIYTYLDVKLFGIMMSWSEVVLLNYGCFTDCRLKGRQTEHLVPP